MANLKNTRINDTGYLGVPAGTTAQRPGSPGVGEFRYNTTESYYEVYNGTEWTQVGSQPLGTEANPATSGYQIAQQVPGATSGYYWIKSSSMPNALEMYVDMDFDGGGYDFYPIQGGTSTSFYNGTHSGTALGLDLVYPRSTGHWQAMSRFVRVTLGFTGSNYSRFFATPGAIYRLGGGGNYTGSIMRDPNAYGSGAPDWRVKDGGKWWLRNSTYSEPNGNYTLGSFLYFWSSDFRENYTGGDLLFDDASTRSTGSYYLVSTNGKP